MNASFLPSKRFGVVVLALAFIGVLFYASQNLSLTSLKGIVSHSEAEDESSILFATSSPDVRQQFEEVDEDGDGLLGWQEELWGTSPFNADSDGDGTPDGQEVAEGRHPAFAGPDDEVQDNLLVSETDIEFSFQTSSGALDSITEELLQKYFTLREEKGELSEEDIYTLTQDVLTESITLPTSREYTENDLFVVEREIQSDIRVYGNDLGRLIEGYRQSLSQFDIVGSLQKGLATQNPAALEALDEISSLLEYLAEDAKEISTPSSAVTHHLNFINTVMRFSQIMGAFTSIHEAPLESAAVIQQFETISNTLDSVERGISEYFEGHGIRYTEGEAGFYFMSNE